jgi:hypothetical protein
VARPKKPAPEPQRRAWGGWSVDVHRPSRRWRVRPPASIDPKRRATYFADRGAAEAWTRNEITRLAAAERTGAADVTLGDWLGYWYAEMAVSRDWSISTQAIYTYELWWFSPCHGILLSALTHAPLQRQVVQLLTVGAPRRPDSTSKLPTRPISPKQVSHAVNTLRRALRSAQSRGLMQSNPAAEVDVPRVVPKRPTVWTREERAKLAPLIACSNGTTWTRACRQ